MSTIRPFDPGGRRVWVPENDAWRIRAVLPTAALSVDEIVREHLGRWRGDVKYHQVGALWIDQGRTSSCTAATSLHMRAAGPVRPDRAGIARLPALLDLYAEIQAEDRAAGRYYAEGATSLAMARVWRRRGWISEFRWGTTPAELLAAVLVEPVAIGVNWYESMFAPDRDGRLHIAGALVGGHAVLVSGVSLRRRVYRLQQSWGRTHGRRGFVEIGFDDMARLIAEQGDVVLARELKDPG